MLSAACFGIHHDGVDGERQRGWLQQGNPVRGDSTSSAEGPTSVLRSTRREIIGAPASPLELFPIRARSVDEWLALSASASARARRRRPVAVVIEM
mmetsp:Transcript_55617/g.136486  ORF Transcript_55617/g.136486 Transcript_55617/m.136486 type:complete len:96 (+) Transcript_55617:75-362(+)